MPGHIVEEARLFALQKMGEFKALQRNMTKQGFIRRTARGMSPMRWDQRQMA
jgi:hypothetical protein